MPPDINSLYEPLFNQICYLHAKWRTFCQLYAQGEETVELLNNIAPSFFHMYQEVLADDVLLMVSRLTDPKQTFKRDNLSLERLASSIDRTKYPTLRVEVEKLLIEAKDQCNFAREHRNRRIAHSDLHTMLNAVSEPLTIATKQKIDDALRSICDVMNAVLNHFEHTTVSYESVMVRDDGDTIIARLRHAEEYRKQRRRRWDGNQSSIQSTDLC